MNSVNIITNLLYKASRDGWKGTDFHKNCDNQGWTLVVVQSENNNIFGGFTKENWDSTNCYKSD